MRSVTKEHGFTLFEILVYIGLLSIILGGAMLGAYQLIESSVRTAQRVAAEEEANFIFRKIDWVLNGEVDDVSAPGNDHLVVEKGADDFDFWVEDGMMLLNNDDTPLTSGAVEVSDFYVEHIVGPPEAISLSFVLNGRQFATTTRYIR